MEGNKYGSKVASNNPQGPCLVSPHPLHQVWNTITRYWERQRGTEARLRQREVPYKYTHFIIENIILILGQIFSGIFFPQNHPPQQPENKKQEHQQQQQKRVSDVRSPDCLFTMSIPAVILFHLFSDNLQFHCCLDIIPIRLYFKSIEVTTLS